MKKNIFWRIMTVEIILAVVAGVLIIAMVAKDRIKITWQAKSEIVHSKASSPMANVYVELPNGKQVQYNKARIIIVGEGRNRTAIVTRQEPPKPSQPPSSDLIRYNVRQMIYWWYIQYYKSGSGQRWLERLDKYQSEISEASQYVGYDEDLARGLFAIEGQGDPYAVNPTSGAYGMGQILSVPPQCWIEAEKVLGVKSLVLSNPRHNIYLSMITLRTYTEGKNGDVLMGTLSYNIGPSGDYVPTSKDYYDFVMKARADGAAKNYVLQVMAITLMSKVRHKYGQILPYTEETKQAFESIPLPGLDSENKSI